MSTEVAELTNENSELKYQLQKSENVEHELAQRVQQLKDAVFYVSLPILILRRDSV